MNSPDERSALAKAIGWSHRVTAISLEMVVPGLIGLWIDWKLGTVLLFLVLGTALGMTLGLRHLIRLAASLNADPEQKPNPQKGDQE